MRLEDLEVLDHAGYRVLDALTGSEIDPPPSGSLANPRGFVVVTGETFWVKAAAQDGLVAELVAGRLAAMTKVGPRAEIVRVTEEAAGGAVDLHALVGVNVGTLNVPDAINARDIATVIGDGRSLPVELDGVSRANVVAFQTWLGVEDSQVLIGLGNGLVHSLDHGSWCTHVEDGAAVAPIVTEIPGVDTDLGREWETVQSIVETIEAVTDENLLAATSCTPQFGAWNAGTDRRFAIAKGLADRRAALRGVMKSWTSRQ